MKKVPVTFCYYWGLRACKISHPLLPCLVKVEGGCQPARRNCCSVSGLPWGAVLLDLETFLIVSDWQDMACVGCWWRNVLLLALDDPKPNMLNILQEYGSVLHEEGRVLPHWRPVSPAKKLCGIASWEYTCGFSTGHCGVPLGSLIQLLTFLFYQTH